VTDPYQPCERAFEVTRRCLEVAAEARQPVGIITKNALVLRDLDLLGEMAAERLAHVNVSVTTLDPALTRRMEPRASTPAARLRAGKELSAAGTFGVVS
jgi:DNA repair photolyase